MSVNSANTLSTSAASTPVFKRFYIEDIETDSDLGLKKVSRKRYFDLLSARRGSNIRIIFPALRVSREWLRCR
jgi:hypothetical protein